MAKLLRGSTIGGKIIASVDDVNAAETSAINWAKSFGLGTTISSAPDDINDLIESGLFYSTTGGINRPPTANHNGYVISVVRTSSYRFQIYVPFNGSGYFYRVNNNGTWRDWVELESTDGAQAKANTAETNAKNASVPTGRTVTAGNGLSGGGALSSNVSLTLGTPGSLSPTSTNAVTATSHTHDVATATQAEAQAGTSSTKFMTPLRTAEAIAALAPAPPVTSVAGKTGAVTLAGTDITSGTVPDARLPDATTSAKGTVQLSTSTSSTSTTLAATASAVKAAYDLANGKADASHTHAASEITSGVISDARLPNATTSAKGTVQLSTATNSTSTTLAATASAVKAAYDLAAGRETTTGAQSKADAAETNAKNHANSMNSIYSADTRSVNSPPSFYDRRFYMEFKQMTTMGVPAVGGTYCTVLTDGRWSGTSGGQVTQIALTDTDRNFFRTSTSTTTWGTWQEFETVAGSQAKANAAETNAKNASVPTGRTVTAGNGMTGGGSLSGNITLTLGTPGSLTPTSTNSVTTTGHTHDVATATAAEAQAGTINTKFMTPLRVKEAINALAPSPPDASTATKGIVQLSSSVGSTSTTLAATASAVKAVNDKWTSSDVGIGASSEAVRLNDIAIGAFSLANAGNDTFSAIALGERSKASSWSTTAIGRYAEASGLNATAIGTVSRAANSHSLALGNGSAAMGTASVAIGAEVSANNTNDGVLGSAGTAWAIPGTLRVTGTKNFEMPHPHPDKKYSHVIRHSAVESPTAGDNLYRYTIEATLDGETVEVKLPDYFQYLNVNVDVWVNGDGHFGRAFGKVEGDTLKVTCELIGKYKVLVIGTRNDEHDSVQSWGIKGVEREIGESWTGETYIFEDSEIITEEEYLTEVIA